MAAMTRLYMRRPSTARSSNQDRDAADERAAVRLGGGGAELGLLVLGQALGHRAAALPPGAAARGEEAQVQVDGRRGRRRGRHGQEQQQRQRELRHGRRAELLYGMQAAAARGGRRGERIWVCGGTLGAYKGGEAPLRPRCRGPLPPWLLRRAKAERRRGSTVERGWPLPRTPSVGPGREEKSPARQATLGGKKKNKGGPLSIF